MSFFVPRVWLLLAVGWMAGLTTACGGNEFSPPLPIAQVIINIGDCNGLQVGQMCTLDVTAIDSGGSLVTDPSFQWSSSELFIATVDFQGNVTGIRAGTTTIRAETQNGQIMDETTLTVVAAPPPLPEDDRL
jgi:hypothetical protein